MIKIIKDKISIDELKKIAKNRFGDLIKAVVDIKKGIMVIDGDLHSDEEVLLLENGSKQENLLGINIYPENKNEDLIEFDSMINLRPWQENRSRGINDPEIRKKVTEIVNQLIENDLST